jgi:hypothetical protein
VYKTMLLIGLTSLCLLACAGCDSTGPEPITTPTPRPQPTPTPIPWVAGPSGHLYFLTAPLPWEDAEVQAVEWGGHLVALGSREEESWIKATFGEDQHLWIGFNDIDQEGVWVWSSGEVNGYTNWAPGDPNDSMRSGAGGEDAAAMNWCAEGGIQNTTCLGDTWNDLPIDGSLPGVVEYIPIT